MNFFTKLRTFILGNQVSVNEKYAQGLAKANRGFKARILALFARYRKLDDALFEELESFLIESDIGGRLTTVLMDAIKAQVRLHKIEDPQAIVALLIENLYHLYMNGIDQQTSHPPTTLNQPHIVLFVGVNGVGKTTSLAKLTYRYQQLGYQPLVVAGDTFRAGAVEQLQVWAQRLSVPIIKGKENSDPASVIYEGIHAGIQQKCDVILCDTAGRLHTKTHLMNELNKISRVFEKKIGRGPDEVLLVIDATTGQNGILQAKAFAEATQVTGIVLTKMDGTSKGGIILAIQDHLHLPVHYIGLGEKLDDLQLFDIRSYLHSLFADLLD